MADRGRYKVEFYQDGKEMVSYASTPTTAKILAGGDGKIFDTWESKYQNTPFSNGAARASEEIANKLGDKIQNTPGKRVKLYKGHAIQDYGNNTYVVFSSDGMGFARATKSSVQEAERWIDSNPLKPYIGSQVDSNKDYL